MLCQRRNTDEKQQASGQQNESKVHMKILLLQAPKSFYSDFLHWIFT